MNQKKYNKLNRSVVMHQYSSAWLISDIWVFDHSPGSRGDLIRVIGPLRQLAVHAIKLALQCLACTIQCEVSSLQCEVCSFQYMCSVQFVVFSVPCTMCSVQFAVSLQCSVCSV